MVFKIYFTSMRCNSEKNSNFSLSVTNGETGPLKKNSASNQIH